MRVSALVWMSITRQSPHILNRSAAAPSGTSDARPAARSCVDQCRARCRTACRSGCSGRPPARPPAARAGWHRAAGAARARSPARGRCDAQAALQAVLLDEAQLRLARIVLQRASRTGTDAAQAERAGMRHRRAPSPAVQPTAEGDFLRQPGVGGDWRCRCSSASSSVARLSDCSAKLARSFTPCAGGCCVLGVERGKVARASPPAAGGNARPGSPGRTAAPARPPSARAARAGGQVPRPRSSSQTWLAPCAIAASQNSTPGWRHGAAARGSTRAGTPFKLRSSRAARLIVDQAGAGLVAVQQQDRVAPPAWHSCRADGATCRLVRPGRDSRRTARRSGRRCCRRRSPRTGAGRRGSARAFCRRRCCGS